MEDEPKEADDEDYEEKEDGKYEDLNCFNFNFPEDTIRCENSVRSLVYLGQTNYGDVKPACEILSEDRIYLGSCSSYH